MNRILLIAAVVVSLATAVVGYFNKTKLDETNSKLVVAQEDLSSATKNLEVKTAEATSNKTALDAAVAEKEKAEGDLKTAQTSLEESKTKLAEAEKQASDKVAEATKAQEDLTAKQSELDQAQKDINQIKNVIASGGKSSSSEEGSGDALDKMKGAEARVAALQSEMLAAKAQAEALLAEKAARQALKARNDMQGQVTAVNKPWNFVVLNLGDRHGVAKGSEMLVRRGNSLIGRVLVKSVNVGDSVADIDVSSVRNGFEILPGDAVIFKAAAEKN